MVKPGSENHPVNSSITGFNLRIKGVDYLLFHGYAGTGPGYRVWIGHIGGRVGGSASTGQGSTFGCWNWHGWLCSRVWLFNWWGLTNPYFEDFGGGSSACWLVPSM